MPPVPAPEQGGAVRLARWAHIPEVAGSNPAPATPVSVTGHPATVVSRDGNQSYGPPRCRRSIRFAHANPHERRQTTGDTIRMGPPVPGRRGHLHTAIHLHPPPSRGAHGGRPPLRHRRRIQRHPIRVPPLRRRWLPTRCLDPHRTGREHGLFHSWYPRLVPCTARRGQRMHSRR